VPGFAEREQTLLRWVSGNAGAVSVVEGLPQSIEWDRDRFRYIREMSHCQNQGENGRAEICKVFVLNEICEFLASIECTLNWAQSKKAAGGSSVWILLL
jgi:hypothetical protein